MDVRISFCIFIIKEMGEESWLGLVFSYFFLSFCLSFFFHSFFPYFLRINELLFAIKLETENVFLSGKALFITKFCNIVPKASQGHKNYHCLYLHWQFNTRQLDSRAHSKAGQADGKECMYAIVPLNIKVIHWIVPQRLFSQRKFMKAYIVIRCNGVWRANQELVGIHNDAAHEELVEIYLQYLVVCVCVKYCYIKILLSLAPTTLLVIIPKLKFSIICRSHPFIFVPIKNSS